MIADAVGVLRRNFAIGFGIFMIDFTNSGEGRKRWKMMVLINGGMGSGSELDELKGWLEVRGWLLHELTWMVSNSI